MKVKMVAIGRKLIPVIHGASNGEFNLAGCTVGAARTSLLDAFNLRRCRFAFVNGEKVPASYRLIEGDTLEFSVGWGKKGGDLEETPKVKTYEQHPYGKVWQRFDDSLLKNFTDDIERRGLDQPCLLYQDMILDGWNRYQACLATGKEPKFIQFEGTDLEAAEKVHASGLRRQVSADQRGAAFLLLMKACPEFNEKFQSLAKKGLQQKKAGKPLPTGGKRVNTSKAKADAMGVGKSTADKLKIISKDNPEAIKEIAKGATSANKVLKEMKEIGVLKKPNKKASPNKKVDPKKASSRSTLLADLKTYVTSLATIANKISHVEWSQEKQLEWDKVEKELRESIEAIFSSSQKGFSSSQESSTKPAEAEIILKIGDYQC